MSAAYVPVLLGEFTPGTPEWYETRRTRVGGSECADVIGLGFSSRYALYWAKAIGLQPEFDPQERELLYWGNAQEPIIVDRFAADLHESEPDAAVQYRMGSYVHPDEPWMLATPDAGIWRHGHLDELVEVKTAARDDAWRAGCPPKYRCQQLWQMHVMGVRRSTLVVKISSADYRVMPRLDMDADPDAEDDLAFLIECGRAFIADVEARRDPVPGDGSEATWEAARRVHPEIDPGSRCEVPEDLVAAWVDADRRAKQAVTDRRLYGAQLLDLMGTTQSGHLTTPEGELAPQRCVYRTARTQPDGTPGTPYLAAPRTAKPKTIKDTRQEIAA